jgi:hypothetical protein
MQINTILAQIDLGAMALPEFQRGYVWNRDQVRDLIASLYRRYPVGGLLIWKTRTEQAHAKGASPLQPGFVDLILDGQQRITSLYGLIRGKAPLFYERLRKDYPFLGLYFNVDTETFKFYSPLEMKDSPLWINITELMQQNISPFVTRLQSMAEFGTYIGRLSTLYGIQTIDLHIEEVTGDDKGIDIVVDIFNKVNSGGTKLSKGDLALAKICASWPEARDEMHSRLTHWEKHGFRFDLDWLLRNMTTVTTGQALFPAITTIPIDEVKTGLKQTEKTVNLLLNTISSRLGLDHDHVLGSRYAFPVMSHYLAQRGAKFHTSVEQNKLLYWYIQTLMWGRYTGSTESTINADMRAAEALAAEGGDPLDALISQLSLQRGDLRVRPEDFGGNSMGARFYPILYLLTRVLKARDWGNGGLELSAHMLGRLQSLQVHHIFPKALLYKHGYGRGETNAIANYCFLTQQVNLDISDKRPENYFPAVEADYPGALASQWVPVDPDLWKVERYRDFLAARRELLAQAANSFLDSLIGSGAQPEPVSEPVLQREEAPPILLGGADEEEMEMIEGCNAWIVSQGLPRGEVLYGLADPETGNQLGVIDLAWPRGVQEGLTQPIALLLNETAELEAMVNQAGYLFFTNATELCAYIERHVLAVAEENVL